MELAYRCWHEFVLLQRMLEEPNYDMAHDGEVMYSYEIVATCHCSLSQDDERGKSKEDLTRFHFCWVGMLTHFWIVWRGMWYFVVDHRISKFNSNSTIWCSPQLNLDITVGLSSSYSSFVTVNWLAKYSISEFFRPPSSWGYSTGDKNSCEETCFRPTGFKWIQVDFSPEITSNHARLEWPWYHCGIWILSDSIKPDSPDLIFKFWRILLLGFQIGGERGARYPDFLSSSHGTLSRSELNAWFLQSLGK